MSKTQIGGFRLEYVEIYNWGTFDQHTWRLGAGCENSLLTGANGSGKTTLVDAIITLLVPPNKRFYNQSSGAESKRERDEKSYTLGAYSTKQSESGLSANTKYLRQKEHAYSILIGAFYNEFSKEYITLAQVRWFANNTLKRAYFVAQEALDVATHFSPMDASGAWKRRLKKTTSVEEFDSFTKYTQRFTKRFGLKSDKALSLFAQTVGIKVLGNLNDFIRTNMLEEVNTDEAFVKLRGHYDNLLQSYQAIERARQQVVLLAPIMEHSESYKTTKKELDALINQEEAVLPFFAHQKAKLYGEAIHSLGVDLKRKSDQIEQIRLQLKDFNEQETQLQVTIRTDKVSEQLSQLAQQIDYAERERNTRKMREERYNRTAKVLELKESPTEKQFYKTLESCAEKLTQIGVSIEEMQQERLQFSMQQRELEGEQKEQQQLLSSLLKRKNSVPLEQVRIRIQLAEKLGISEKNLPFAAELIRIKEAEKADWQNSIEQLLRPLATTILLRDEYYTKAIEFLHRMKLNGKIKLLHVKEELLDANVPDKKSILHKIEVRQNQDLTDWLKNYLNQHYAHMSLEGFSTIHRYAHGINSKGLIKSENTYERDGDTKRWSNGNYVLGWDNQATILLVQRKLKGIEAELESIEKSIQNRKRTERNLLQQRDSYTRLQEFEEYSEIAWKVSDKTIKRLQAEREELLKSSDHLKVLQRQLEDVQAKIVDASTSRDRYIEQRGTLQNRLDNYSNSKIETDKIVAQYQGVSYRKYVETFKEMIAPEEIRVHTANAIETRLRRSVSKDRESKSRALDKVENRLNLAMQRFIQPSPEILEQHPNWTAETLDLRPEMSYLKEYQRIYKRVQEEELPKYQSRFKEWLNERLIYDIANFKGALDNQETIIKDSIETINKSLRSIRFNANPDTYIQLDIHITRDQSVRDFKQMLREAMPDVGKLASGDEKELEAAFKRIKLIIEELSNNENWRRKVTDVRNWLEFAAIERFLADDQERQYYQDSRSLSGGEKAKLAYTILASAIAYQFGIRSENNKRRSFRFAVVDEAFSKVDPANAIYAMELFKQLDLQLMVVTPLDKINLAEPYIQTVHYVQNREKRNSEVFDVPMEVYFAEKNS